MAKKCFADAGKECLALNEKHCQGCYFYKPVKRAVEELKNSAEFHTNDDLQEILRDIKKHHKV